MISRSKQTAKMDKTDQRSLEERLDHLTTIVEAQQKILERFMALYESEKLQSLSQREDEEKQKKDAIVAKDAEIEKMRREISNMKLAMERQTAIYVRDKITWEQERDHLQKEVERFKALSQRASTHIIPKLQVTTKDLSKSHKCTDCNEYSTDLRSYLESHRSVGYKASPCYDCTVCNKQFLRKDNYDRHLATHENKDTALHQIQGIEAAFARNKRRQAIREEYQLEYNMCAEQKEKKQPKRVVLTPPPDAFSTFDFETLDMNLKGTLRNMEQMRKLEPTSVPTAAAGQKEADSQNVEKNASLTPNVEAEIAITKKSWYSLLQSSLGPVLAADQEQTVMGQVKQNKVLSSSKEAAIEMAAKALCDLGSNFRPLSASFSTAVQKQTVEEQVEQNKVLSPSNKAEIKVSPKVLSIQMSNFKPAPVPASEAGQKQRVKGQVEQNEVLSSSDKAEIKIAAKNMFSLRPKSILIPVSVSKPYQKPTVEQKVEQKEVLSPRDKSEINMASKALFSLASNCESVLESVSAVVQKQTIKRQVKQNEVLSPSDEAVKALYSLMEEHRDVPASAAEEKQTVKQRVKQDVVFSPKNEAKIKEAEKRQARSALTSEDDKSSSASTPAAPEPSTIVPTSDPIDVNLRRNLRHRFVGLLHRHRCTYPACSILAFRGYVKHASKCVDGPDCSWYICKRVQAKTEHLKTCRDKLDCTFCQPYICFNENKMQGMMKVLEKGCPLNQGSVNRMSESTKEAIMTMVARLAVNYGFVGDDEKPNNEDDDGTPDLEDEIFGVDVEALSSSSESLSSSSSESPSSCSETSSSDEEESSDEEDTSEGEKTSDEEDTSEGEKTSEEWEIVEAERRQEVD